MKIERKLPELNCVREYVKENADFEKEVRKLGFVDELAKDLLELLALLAAGLISVPFGFGMFTLLRLGKVDVVTSICMAFFVTGMLMASMKVETHRTK